MAVTTHTQRYRRIHDLSPGSDSLVCLGVDTVTGGPVLIKTEKRRNSLRHESEIYQSLQGGSGISCLHEYELHGVMRDMVLDFHGLSLHALFILQRRRFSLKTVLLLAEQMLCRIEYVHSRSIIHRNMSPSSFLMGIGRQRHTVYLTQFKRAAYHRTGQMSKQDTVRQYQNMEYYSPYASVNSHLGYPQSGRDDLESLSYIWIEFLRGRLPWAGFDATLQETQPWLLMAMKYSISPERLCQDLPEEFLIYHRYVTSLAFDEKPDYAYLRRLFQGLFQRRQYDYDRCFDWSAC